MRLTVAAVLIVMLVALVIVSRRNTYTEIDSENYASFSFSVDENGASFLTVWEATWYFPINHENIRVWDEIEKDVGWFQVRSWRNADHILMYSTGLERKTVCSCTPVRSIVDYEKTRPTRLLSKKTVASYSELSNDGSNSATLRVGAVLQGPEHENCTSIEVNEMVTTVSDGSPSSVAFIKELQELSAK